MAPIAARIERIDFRTASRKAALAFSMRCQRIGDLNRFGQRLAVALELSRAIQARSALSDTRQCRVRNVTEPDQSDVFKCFLLWHGTCKAIRKTSTY